MLQSVDRTVYRNTHAEDEVAIKNFSKALIGGKAGKGPVSTPGKWLEATSLSRLIRAMQLLKRLFFFFYL